jgi:hypothetical protein
LAPEVIVRKAEHHHAEDVRNEESFGAEQKKKVAEHH